MKNINKNNLPRYVYSKVARHFSFIVIGLGAICYFAGNILLKNILSTEDYGTYSLFITYLSAVFLFSMLGSEQIFMRYSYAKEKNEITTQKFKLKLIATILVFTTAGATSLFLQNYSFIPLNPVLLYTTTISIGGILFLFNIFRLNCDFVAAQLIFNFWKIVLLPISAGMLLFQSPGLAFILSALSISIILIFLAALYSFCKKIRFKFSSEISHRQIVTMTFQFFISIASFSAVMFADRFIIERKLGIEEVGNYFYLTNFFIAPFSILQNYIGFRQLVIFKNSFDIQSFRKHNKITVYFGILLGLILFCIPIFSKYLYFFKFDFEAYIVPIILLIMLGITRLYSSSITSAFESQTNLRSLQLANLFIVSSSIIIIVCSLLICNSLSTIIGSFMLIWIIRCVIMQYFILKQYNMKEFEL